MQTTVAEPVAAPNPGGVPGAQGTYADQRGGENDEFQVNDDNEHAAAIPDG